METIKIVTDSSITIDPALADALGITIVPLTVMIDGVIYNDTDLKEEGKFLKLMRDSKEMPKTSQPPVGVFAEVYENLVRDGADKIVSIHITHALSGTVEAARQGAAISGVDVTVLDSDFTDQSMMHQVVAAAKLAQEGASLETILAKVEEVRKNSELFIGVSTLENLVKGGRIGRVSGMISSLLNIRVVLQLKDAAFTPIVKGRGQKTFSKWLDSFIDAAKDRPIAEIGISYSGAPTWANEVKSRLSTLVDPDKITVSETGSIIQTHTGEDAFAVMVHYE